MTPQTKSRLGLIPVMHTRASDTRTLLLLALPSKTVASRLPFRTERQETMVKVKGLLTDLKGIHILDPPTPLSSNFTPADKLG